MHTIAQYCLAGAMGGAIILAAGGAFAACDANDYSGCEGKPWVIGKAETPIGEKWWPNKLWGADDEAGSTNWYTKSDVVARAVAEADKGKVYSLGRPYTADMPLFGTRQFVLRIPGAPTGGPFGANNVIWHDEFLATEVGQVGTQFDGLGHIGVVIGGTGDKDNMRFYNGFTETEIASSNGLLKLGTEKLHPIVARGILIDVAGYKGVEAMEAGQEITLDDVKGALKKQGMEGFEFLPGDAVLFRTGWSKYWITDNAKYNSGEPGIGGEVARWLSDDVQAGVWGGDTWATEVVPNPDPACAFCVHQHMLARHGIVNQENMLLDGLATDQVYRFMYMYTPAPIAGATGSMGSPIAVD
ncbi:MAG: cyclase family protein [Thalassobaculaceae bacterium]|nr:cyclase family protein [Thalassobaculaceae bacterium]